jgi:hypothetical protein
MVRRSSPVAGSMWRMSPRSLMGRVQAAACQTWPSQASYPAWCSAAKMRSSVNWKCSMQAGQEQDFR